MSAINVKFAFVKYCTGEKEIISVDRIKGFNAKNINFEKKYKILWNEAYYDGVIILVAESEEALEAKIGKTRPRLRPMDLYMSASENDTGCKLLENNNTSTKESTTNKIEKELLFAKKLKNTSSRKPYITTNDKVEKFKKEIEYLKKQIAELKFSLQKKENLAESYFKSNLALQKDVIEEIKELKNIIMEQQTKKKDEGQHNKTLFPIGHRRETDNNIHVGQNIWISSQVYDSAVCISKSPSVFTKNMALAIFGAQVLKESSVTGTVSNRIKGKNTLAARPKLDPQRFLALKDIVRYWLHTVKKYDEMAIDLEINLVGKHLSQKIYELNRERKIKTVNLEKTQEQSTIEVPVTKEADVAIMDDNSVSENSDSLDENKELS
ncbi:BEN domain-containing protein 5-like isoform X2 [Linepithema humile]|uniref:BEN domain-containing protein 5-like isoform X2 n=1 Tax=Linepithema humile TaxID=83485 RepID=UPI00351E815E